VKILHLSDLHVTHDGRELNQLWGRAGLVMAGQRFDFVVISGDLTQRAAATEYAKLKRFPSKRSSRWSSATATR